MGRLSTILGLGLTLTTAAALFAACGTDVRLGNLTAGTGGSGGSGSGCDDPATCTGNAGSGGHTAAGTGGAAASAGGVGGGHTVDGGMCHVPAHGVQCSEKDDPICTQFGAYCSVYVNKCGCCKLGSTPITCTSHQDCFPYGAVCPSDGGISVCACE
jgi:hypothetical protein